MGGAEGVTTPDLPIGVKRRQPVARKGDTTEQALLDSLERLLVEQPLAAVAVDRIAAGAGVSRVTFYSYFPSKHAALVVRLHHVLDQLNATTDEFVAALGDPLRMHETFRRAAEQWRDHFPVLGAAIASAPHDAELRELLECWTERVTDALVTGHRSRDRALLRALIWSSERTMYGTFSRSTSNAALDEVVELLERIWFGSLAWPPGRKLA